MISACGQVAAAASVVINEVVSSNKSGLTDEDGDRPDWFELYNAGDAQVNLEGWGLSESKKSPFKWVLHQATLAPGKFLTIFASGKDRQPSVPTGNLSQVAGMKVWLAADGVATNDPSQVRINGGKVYVRRWRDQSGAGNDALQELTSAQPTWVSGAMGNRPALHFDGMNSLLSLAGPLATNSFTVVAVFRATVGHEIDPESASGVGGVQGQHWLFGAHYQENDGGAGLSVGTNGISAYEHGSFYMPALAVYAGPVGAAVNVVSLVYQDRRPSIALRGQEVRTGLTSSRPQVLAPFEIGSGTYGAFAGDVAEVLLFDRGLGEATRRVVESYLAAKYGLDFDFLRHTNFKLDASGETLSLTRPDGTLADRVDIPALPGDISYGRQPDGVGGWGYFASPSPGEPNLGVAAHEILPEPIFSAVGGFYSNDFDLAIQGAGGGAVIRYTLDGSDPTGSSTLYTGAIRIKSRKGTPNGISTIPTTPGGPVPAGEVFKGTVVRAKIFKAGALSMETVTQSYFVHPRGRARYSLPVVSLNTDPRNFFDPTIGIYVPGNAPGYNYSQRGTDWERPVFVEVFETNGQRVIAQGASAKIHGNTSQAWPIKGLDLDSHGGGGRAAFHYPFFPNRQRAEFSHLLLRPSGQDQDTAFMRDELMQAIIEETGADTQAARACVTFINGEYWGLSYLKEKEDEEFIANLPRAGAGQDFDYLEGFVNVRLGDTLHYDSMLAFMGTNDLRQDTNYAAIQGMMDVDNYITYKAAEIFNYRWDMMNHRLWRPRTNDGRWRWLPFDNDVGWGGFWAIPPPWAFNMLSADLTPDGSLNGHNTPTSTYLLRTLMGSEQFKRAFINRFADLMNDGYSSPRLVDHVDQIAAVLTPEMAEHTVRWRSPASLSDWQAKVGALRTFAVQRPTYVRQQIVQQFGLPGTAVVRLGVAQPGGGTIKVNTLSTSANAKAAWEGVYFKGVPVRIGVVPAPGYRFSAWSGSSASTSDSLQLSLASDTTLTATFVPAIEATTPVLKDDQVKLEAKGPANSNVVLEVSEDLQHWDGTFSGVFDSQGTLSYFDSISARGHRFYRFRVGP
ncbi:MAG TPA: CotH kinase family protein [Candidatus Limnocylindria bacterium]|nr:CotH kinase family protein [Candidatus Limnocylindria bacterium]